MAQKHGLDEVEATLLMNAGAVLLAQGQLDNAWTQLQHSRNLYESAGSRQYLPEVLRYMAEVKLVQGLTGEASALAEEARRIATETGRETEQQEAEALLARIQHAATA